MNRSQTTALALPLLPSVYPLQGHVSAPLLPNYDPLLPNYYMSDSQNSPACLLGAPHGAKRDSLSLALRWEERPLLHSAHILAFPVHA